MAEGEDAIVEGDTRRSTLSEHRYGYDKATKHHVSGHRKWPCLCMIMEEKAFVEYLVLQPNIPPLCAIQMCFKNEGHVKYMVVRCPGFSSRCRSPRSI